MLLNKPERIRFIKFALVGISGTFVDFLLFNLFLRLGFSSVVSSAFSFSIAVLNNFIWNRLWTYPESREFTIANQLGKFAIVSMIGLAVRTAILFLIEQPVIGITSSLLPVTYSQFSEVIGKNLSLSIVIVFVLFWNYFGNKFWTYKGVAE